MNMKLLRRAFRLRKDVYEGYKMPPFYGAAIYAVDRRITVCYPIPLNLLVSGLHRLRVWLKEGWVQAPIGVQGIYRQGFADGVKSVAWLTKPPKDVEGEDAEYW